MKPKIGTFYIDLWYRGKVVRHYGGAFVDYYMTHNDTRFGSYLTHGFIVNNVQLHEVV